MGRPGHFVVGHFGADPPLLLDPFRGGVPIETTAPRGFVRAWRPQEIAMRMLNNLDGLIGRESRIYGLTDTDRMRDHYKDC